ncbi:FtsB family cell division protein [Aureimonas pseudogalii]|uniref:Cell division protein FtsB n=1 Tax=Aureimonas pseudogalii TaxID=1744844 RepID=A0A7W6H508_9HYPH|nr:septum formation initiator family protein [Aureimonas pseudogalii]MBB3998671.1 cell division protein FtsB [Aureimonas pseudogalii]
MQTRQKRKSWLKPLIVPAITLPCLVYFTQQSQSGRYGVEAGAQMAAELTRKTQMYNRLVANRKGLEQRVRLLSDGTLERDMIDERARRALNMSNDDEITILMPKGYAAE